MDMSLNLGLKFKTRSAGGWLPFVSEPATCICKRLGSDGWN